jgi:hypothetical protein
MAQITFCLSRMRTSRSMRKAAFTFNAIAKTPIIESQESAITSRDVLTSTQMNRCIVDIMKKPPAGDVKHRSMSDRIFEVASLLSVSRVIRFEKLKSLKEFET